MAPRPSRKISTSEELIAGAGPLLGLYPAFGLLARLAVPDLELRAFRVLRAGLPQEAAQLRQREFVGRVVYEARYPLGGCFPVVAHRAVGSWLATDTLRVAAPSALRVTGTLGCSRGRWPAGA